MGRTSDRAGTNAEDVGPVGRTETGWLESLPGILRHRALTEPMRRHLVLLEADREVGSLTFGDLSTRAEAMAAALCARGVGSGDTIALMLPTGWDLFVAFMGTLLAGAVPVPLYPPVRVDRIEEYARRQLRILENAQARALLVMHEARHLGRLLRPRLPSLRFVAEPSELEREGGTPPGDVWSRDDLALIQYTSGSTGDPKGVALTHTNLLANVRAIGETIGVGPRDVIVSWLPLYHDMGLIGCWLFALCHGLEMVVFSPLDFLRRPARWLRAISDYRGTLSPAPNFAYELSVRRIQDRELEGVDLASWRIALDGAEPVNPNTLDRFTDRFSAWGFRREALLPAYGLAENAVALTFPPVGRGPRTEDIERDTYHRESRAVPIESGQDAGTEGRDGVEPLRTVSVGSPLPGCSIRLVDDEGSEVGERREGNIEFRGPSATAGYYRSPEATAGLRTPDGWIRTGDRGYCADGELFVTGRKKDLIIKAGRNLDPAEIEVFAARVEGVRQGCVAAIGVPNERTGSEDLVVVAETRCRASEARRRMKTEIRRLIRAAVKVAPGQVVLVPPRTLPKTPSGKLCRAETRRRFLGGRLVRRGLPIWLQVLRLAVGTAWVAALAWFWSWSRKPRSWHEKERSR